MLWYFCSAHSLGECTSSLGKEAIPVGTLTGILERDNEGRFLKKYTLASSASGGRQCCLLFVVTHLACGASRPLLKFSL